MEITSEFFNKKKEKEKMSYSKNLVYYKIKIKKRNEEDFFK